MPWSLKRYQNSGTLHFVTFSCYRRQPLLSKPGAAHMFEQALEIARLKYGFFVFGYVVMPEHVHLLVSEPERDTLATAIKATVGRATTGQDRRTFLAATLLRFQRRHSTEARREVKVHSR